MPAGHLPVRIPFISERSDVAYFLKLAVNIEDHIFKIIHVTDGNNNLNHAGHA